MIAFRVEVHGVYRETWEVDAHDIHDAIRRIEWAEGSWLDAGWVGEPRYVAKPVGVIEKELAAVAAGANAADSPPERRWPI